MLLLQATLILLGLLWANPSYAVEMPDDGLEVQLSTTISHGLTFGVGKGDDPATDTRYGYQRDVKNSTTKVISEFDLGYRNFGAFVRATGFYDSRVEPGESDDLEVLDAYVSGDFEISSTQTSIRLGSHVLNWGESSYILHGINVTNPLDLVSRLRPGSEIREQLLPVQMASMVVSPSLNLSLEGYYEFGWEPSRLLPIPSVTFDQPADNSGQWGIALRYFAEALQGTDFGLYIVKHHSRWPIISARQGDRNALSQTLGLLRQPGVNR